jgi:class 3 adenylate cyclase
MAACQSAAATANSAGRQAIDAELRLIAGGAVVDPNDVLVSSTLRDLVIGSGLEFEDRGAHVLKGVPGEWRLFAVAS